jgi:hypothetical protein
MAACVSDLNKLRQIKNFNELRVRSSQLFSSWLDRVWIRLPDFSNTEFQLPPGLPESLANVYLSSHENSLEHVEHVAQRVTDGKINIFGREVDAGITIPWHKDVFHGQSSQQRFWKDIHYLNGSQVGDSEVIWELNRLQFLIPVAKAYFLTGDRTYYEWIRNTVLDWIESNPYPKGINWASSLELAFRTVTLDWVVRFCRKALHEDKEFCDSLLEMLAIHGRHIIRYLSTYFSPNTHLTGEALGLYLLGSRYKFLPGAERWRKIGWKVLLDCLHRHVLPDGGYFERSLWYHRYTLEIYLLFSILAREAGESLPDVINAKLGDLSDFLAQAVRDDGTFPLIGDDDGGRLLALDDEDPADPRSLLAVVSSHLRRSDLKYVADNYTESIWWLLGEKGIEQYGKLSSLPPESTGSVYVNTGYAFLRDSWKSPSTVISLDAGPHGDGNCGHAHGDALGMTLSHGTEHIVIDPGTYCYTLDMNKRNLMRSPEAHSTALIEGLPSSVPGSLPFSWKSHSSKVQLEESFVGWDLDLIGGCSKIYQDLGADLVHRRKLLFLKPRNLLLVWDILDGHGSFDVSVQYILGDSGWQRMHDAAYSRFKKDIYVNIAVSPDHIISSALEPFEFSPGYLRLSEGKQLKFNYKISVPDALVTVFAWGDSTRHLSLEKISAHKVVIRENKEEIWCLTSDDSNVSSNYPLTSDAVATCVVSNGEKVSRAWALSVSNLTFLSETLLKSTNRLDRWEIS